ncbi:winged helix-turn-helix domain-containing protein [Enterobacter pasteurii]|uniref:winged helix-turn-helix domain-containing protein n=1 Tax=Enterobacter pasteurii TaxID=3029761 RepID=UPI002108F18F|nr:winged helix-turn-helix domain-containing protein [Enterobacter pasteurii]
MKNSSTKQGKIFFLDYTFNPALRTLQREDTILQLRKKQSDVLALLCAKYPSPVSQDEFLSEVWDGSYVTSQSIAQMIRSLRISLKDESKNIIVTIPKLGYQLTAEPTWEASLSEPELEPDTLNERSPAAGTIELDNISYSAKPITSYQPAPPTTSMTVVSYVPQHKPVGRKLTSRKWFIFAVATLSIFLAGWPWGQGDMHRIFLKKRRSSFLADCWRSTVRPGLWIIIYTVAKRITDWFVAPGRPCLWENARCIPKLSKQTNLRL